jgi:hypothetical protein
VGPGMMGHTYNYSTKEAEAWGSQIWNQPGLHGKFHNSLDYVVSPYVKN